MSDTKDKAEWTAGPSWVDSIRNAKGFSGCYNAKDIKKLVAAYYELLNALEVAQAYMSLSLGSTYSGVNPYPIIEDAIALARSDEGPKDKAHQEHIIARQSALALRCSGNFETLVSGFASSDEECLRGKLDDALKHVAKHFAALSKAKGEA